MVLQMLYLSLFSNSAQAMYMLGEEKCYIVEKVRKWFRFIHILW